MKISKIELLNMFVLAALAFQSTALADVVYDNTATVTSVMTTTEIGDTVTLAGTKRFINSFTIGLYVGSRIGETEHLILRFYLPNAPGEAPGRLLWQSPPLIDIPLTEEVQLVTFEVPEIRVPDTFIWCVQHGGNAGFAICNPPTVGTSPGYAWTNLTKHDYPNSNFMAIIEATDRSDADLLGTARTASYSGIGTEERHNMRFHLFAPSVGLLKGAAFFGVTEWDVGTAPSLAAADYPEFVDILTNGADDNITRYSEYAGNTMAESSRFTKVSGIAPDYPDFHGCIITDIALKLDNIIIDHSTPGWTYFTWDVTWEIWGFEKSADFNRDGRVDLLDFSILGAAWDSQTGQTHWNPVCDICLPEDDEINSSDLQLLCSSWLDGCFRLPGFDENFETGDFSQHDWQHSQNTEWNIVSDISYEGSYAAKSATITHNEQSILQVEIDVDGEDVSFYKKVSSEANYDYLRFYIDGAEQNSWSGEIGWSQESFSITPGLHTLKWAYTKDGSVSTGSDCAWIDQIKVE